MASDSFPTCGTPAAGYVYLSASRTMPGFVQLSTSAEDPSRHRWSLETMSGATHFRCIYAAPTGDMSALSERFREVLEGDEIPHHDGFFHMPARFAQQILQAESRAFPGGPTRRPAAWRRPLFVAITLGAVMVSSLGFTPRPPAPEAQPQPAPIVHPSMPKFRL